MAITTLVGTASHVATGTEIGYVPKVGFGGPTQTTNHLITLRVDGKPVRIKLKDTASITDGDTVAVAGQDKQGTLEAFAFKNKTTGATHYPPALLLMIGGGVVVLISIPMMALLVGFPMAALGGYFIYLGNNIRQAVAALQNT